MTSAALEPPAPAHNAPPIAIGFLAAAAAWPLLAGVALGAGLRGAGFSVGQVAPILAAEALPASLVFLWAPIVDSSATRRRWYLAGVAVMGSCLVGLFMAPWKPAAAGVLMALAFTAALASTFAAAALKGLIAHQVAPEKLPSASGWFVAGGVCGKNLAGAGTLWLMTHLASREIAILISVPFGLVCASALAFTAPETPVPIEALPTKVLSAALETARLIFTRRGALVATLSVIPFGAAPVISFAGSIAPDWSVSADLLAGLTLAGAVTNAMAALGGGWLATKIGHWAAYVAAGWAVIFIGIAWAVAPHVPAAFVIFEIAYRAASCANLAALFAIIMATVGRGAASAKASTLTALAAFSSTYPVLILGAVHDRSGPGAMLLADAGLSFVGFLVLCAVSWLVGMRPRLGAALAPAANS